MSYAPHIAFWAQRGRALTGELVGGNQERLSGTDCATIATRAIGLLAPEHGPVDMRIDCAYYDPSGPIGDSPRGTSNAAQSERERASCMYFSAYLGCAPGTLAGVDSLSRVYRGSGGLAMSNTDPGRSFAEHLREAPLAPDTSAKIILTGEVRRCISDDRFVLISQEIGTVTLDVAAVTDYEPVEGGLTRLTLDAASVRELSTAPTGAGAVPFLMATPHHASPEVIRAQVRNAEMSAAILDVETGFIKDVWGDEPRFLRS